MLTITGEITADSELPGVDADRIGPFTIQVDRDGSIFRRRINLVAGQWYTPNMDGLTPYMFAVFNTGLVSVSVGFGQGEPIVIPASGPPAIWPGNQVPQFLAASGAGVVVLWVLTET